MKRKKLNTHTNPAFASHIKNKNISIIRQQISFHDTSR